MVDVLEVGNASSDVLMGYANAKKIGAAPVHGIPLPLLRTFLSGIIRAKLESAQDWVAWVARVCHGSLDPGMGQELDTSDCAMKYDVGRGWPGFTYSNGGVFDLDAWTKAR